jgi:hypothetical protein
MQVMPIRRLSQIFFQRMTADQAQVEVKVEEVIEEVVHFTEEVQEAEI